MITITIFLVSTVLIKGIQHKKYLLKKHSKSTLCQVQSLNLPSPMVHRRINNDEFELQVVKKS